MTVEDLIGHFEADYRAINGSRRLIAPRSSTARP
jgi:hypothetical protein